MKYNANFTVISPLSEMVFVYVYTDTLPATGWGQAAVGAKLQATNRVPRPVDRGTATRYGG